MPPTCNILHGLAVSVNRVLREIIYFSAGIMMMAAGRFEAPGGEKRKNGALLA